MYTESDWMVCAKKVRLMTNYKPTGDMRLWFTRNHALKEVAKMTAKEPHI